MGKTQNKQINKSFDKKRSYKNNYDNKNNIKFDRPSYQNKFKPIYHQRSQSKFNNRNNKPINNNTNDYQSYRKKDNYQSKFNPINNNYKESSNFKKNNDSSKSFIKKQKQSRRQYKKQQHFEEQIQQQKQPIDIQNSPQQNKPSRNLQEKNKQKQKKHNRIIIRNIPFDIKQKHLKKLLQPYGQIKEISVPLHPDKNINKGFAFIEYTNKNHCHSAINKLNGTTYKGRTIILDFSIPKNIYLQQKINQKQKRNQQNISIQGDQQKVKKQDKKQEKIQAQQENNQQDNQDQKQQENQNDQQQNQLKKQEKKEKKNNQNHVQDLSSTIFVRNLPISVDDKGLFNHFRKYGKIKYARVVIDSQSKLSKGSGFVKFVDAKPAQELIQQSRSYELSLSKKLKHFQPNPAITLQIQGNIIKIFDAANRDHLSAKINQRNKQGDKKEDKKAIPLKKIRNIQRLVDYDKNNNRNIKLALQGIWKAQQTMNKHDYQKFKNHERQKLEKLKNPNYFVSMTRVILKGLDKKITQQDIKKLAHQYLASNNMKYKQLTYCKLMLDNQMKNSAGYAFLEFSRHQISLDFINFVKQQKQRLSNKNYICEFAIEDSRKLLKKGKKITKKTK